MQAFTEARRACFTVIDFETTGSVAGYSAEPWQVGMVRVQAGGVVTERCCDAYFRVGDRPVNPYAPGRLAEVRETLADAPSAAECWPTLAAWICGVPLVAHNVGTERTVLRQVAPLHRLGPWVDTLRLVRYAYPRLRSNALEAVIAALSLAPRVSGLCPGRRAHDALYDAFACAVLLEHLLALPGWERVTVEALASM